MVKFTGINHWNVKSITLLWLLAWPCVLSLFASEGQARPNIIFILTDDQSYGSMGISGNSLVRTPNLDQLVASVGGP